MKTISTKLLFFSVLFSAVAASSVIQGMDMTTEKVVRSIPGAELSIIQHASMATENEDAGPIKKEIKEGSVDGLRKLIESNTDVNMLINSVFHTPLIRAITHNKEKMVDLLIKLKADVNQAAYYSTPPLVFATGSPTITKLLIDNNADVNEAGKDGFNALLCAARENNLDTVALLVAGKADVNLCSDHGHTALAFAKYNKNEQMVRRLKSFETMDMETEEDAALLKKIEKGDVDGVRQTIESGVNVNMKLGLSTPLIHAIDKDNSKVVWLLMQLKADVNQEGFNSTTPLLTATNSPTITRLLVNNRADVNKADKDGFSPLLYATRENNVGTVEVLVAHSADINHKSDNDATALACAKMALSFAKNDNNQRMVSLLTSFGATDSDN